MIRINGILNNILSISRDRDSILDFYKKTRGKAGSQSKSRGNRDAKRAGSGRTKRNRKGAI